MFVDISEFLEKKIGACECYFEEMRPSPHARSVENVVALAKFRGHSVGVDAAEAFAVYRMIK